MVEKGENDLVVIARGEVLFVLEDYFNSDFDKQPKLIFMKDAIEIFEATAAGLGQYIEVFSDDYYNPEKFFMFEQYRGEGPKHSARTLFEFSLVNDGPLPTSLGQQFSPLPEFDPDTPGDAAQPDIVIELQNDRVVPLFEIPVAGENGVRSNSDTQPEMNILGLTTIPGFARANEFQLLGQQQLLKIIDPDLGILALAPNAQLDFEMQSQYIVPFSAVNEQGQLQLSDFTLQLRDVNDAPEVQLNAVGQLTYTESQNNDIQQLFIAPQGLVFDQDQDPIQRMDLTLTTQGGMLAGDYLDLHSAPNGLETVRSASFPGGVPLHTLVQHFPVFGGGDGDDADVLSDPTYSLMLITKRFAPSMLSNTSFVDNAPAVKSTSLSKIVCPT